MTRYLGIFLLALAAVAEEPALSNLQILQWQVEAQARERALNRRIESQIEKGAANPADQLSRRPESSTDRSSDHPPLPLCPAPNLP